MKESEHREPVEATGKGLKCLWIEIGCKAQEKASCHCICQQCDSEWDSIGRGSEMERNVMLWKSLGKTPSLLEVRGRKLYENKKSSKCLESSDSA